MAQSRKYAHAMRGRAVPKKRSRVPLILTVVMLAFLVIGGVALSRLSQPSVAVTPFTARPINAPTGTTEDGFAYKGRPDAPVTVIEYGDFQCPSCAAFSTQMESQFTQQYIETGKVRFIYHDLPLPQHDNSIIAATAARAAGEQGKFWAMHDLLFERQRAWSGSSNIKALLGSYAEAIGLDRTAFEQVLNSNKYTPALESARDASMARGVNATPTFDVDGKLVSASELDGAVAAALQAKGQ